MRRWAVALTVAVLLAGCDTARGTRPASLPPAPPAQETAPPEPRPEPPPEPGPRPPAAGAAPAPATGISPAPASGPDDGTADVALALHNALWAGDRPAAARLIDPSIQPPDESRTNGRSAPFSAGWPALLWQSQDSAAREREGEPEVSRVSSAGSVQEVLVRFCAWEDGLRWCYTESVLVERDTRRVTGFYRSPVPYHRAGGAEPGYAAAAAPVGPLIRLGPFLDPAWDRAVVWSPDGARVAAHVFGVAGNEIWAADAGGGNLKLMWQANLPLGERGMSGRPLGWAGNRLWLVTWGDGGAGYTLISLGHPAGDRRIEATVAADNAGPSGSAWATADGRWAVFWRSPRIWRVDLRTGRVDLLSDQVPSWDGLFWMIPSPDGQHAAWVESNPGRVTVVDIAAGAVHTWETGWESVQFRGWTGPGRLLVALGWHSGIWSAPDAWVLTAATELRLYTATGEVAARVAPPAGTAVGPRTLLPGGRCAYVTGRMEPNWHSEDRMPPFYADALWVWDGGEPRRLRDLGGQAVEYLDWDGEAVRVWYHPGPRDHGSSSVDPWLGLKVNPDTGRAQPIARPANRRPAAGTLWAAGGTRLVERDGARGAEVVLAGPGGEQVLHRGAVAAHVEAGPGGRAAVVVEDNGRDETWVYLAPAPVPQK